LANWTEFYSVTATAAASLLGLLFVTVSINANESLGPGQGVAKRSAEQAFQNYLAALVVSLLALIPDMRPKTLGYAVMAVTLLWGTWACIRFFLVLRENAGIESRRKLLRRHGTSILAFALLLYAGVTMRLGSDTERDMLAAALILLLSSATMVSWQLLLLIARRRHQEEEKK
jgi:hypothetical protein